MVIDYLLLVGKEKAGSVSLKGQYKEKWDGDFWEESSVGIVLYPDCTGGYKIYTCVKIHSIVYQKKKVNLQMII